jgi:carbamoyl-phosphate synthase large subunit
MKPEIKIAITAGGAPQSATLIRHLKHNKDCTPVHITSLDMNHEVCGNFMADSFHKIPAAGSPGYRDKILEIIQIEKPDAFLNSCGADVPYIAKMKNEIEALGTKVLVSDAKMIELADNKYRLFTKLQNIPGIEVPEFYSPSNLKEFVEIAEKMGYPERDLCFKPHVSKGSRGFRILTNRFDRRDLLLNYKPTALYMTLEEFVELFTNADEFPQLILMEVVSGEECDVMTIGHNGEALLTTVKSRESHRWGIIDRGELVDRPELVRSTSKIIEQIPLDYNISIQFIAGKIIEINPRTSTFIYTEEFNEPWLAVKLALDLISPMEVKAYQNKIPYGTRMLRYMDQIFFKNNDDWAN